jgi:formylglycine-generating enzyme
VHIAGVRHAFSLGVVVACAGAAIALAAWWGDRGDGARCGRGFVARGARCLLPEGACPAPLEWQAYGCDAPDVRVSIPAADVTLGPSDWEAQGASGPAGPRTLHGSAFRIDAFEATRGAWRRAGAAPLSEEVAGATDPARAAAGMTRAEAADYCARRGGRLPSEDEWIVAAVSAANPPRRYPWGDTGAVCRRGAWGLQTGPCSNKGTGPDTVGAHDDGASPLGLHDLAGNVAEWVAPAASDGSPEAGDGGGGEGAIGVAKGGSWQSSLAADLRVWARAEVPASARRPDLGVRCVYPP